MFTTVEVWNIELLPVFWMTLVNPVLPVTELLLLIPPVVDPEAVLFESLPSAQGALTVTPLPWRAAST
jgi:hypothetical protein